jgi:hypothetical protein
MRRQLDQLAPMPPRPRRPEPAANVIDRVQAADSREPLPWDCSAVATHCNLQGGPKRSVSSSGREFHKARLVLPHLDGVGLSCGTSLTRGQLDMMCGDGAMRTTGLTGPHCGERSITTPPGTNRVLAALADLAPGPRHQDGLRKHRATPWRDGAPSGRSCPTDVLWNHLGGSD